MPKGYLHTKFVQTPTAFPLLMQTPRILFICGSLNQTTMMHQIAMHLPETEQYFSPYYADGFVRTLVQNGYLDFTILGGSFRQATEEYLRVHNLSIDYGGERQDYDLVLTCSDLLVPRNIRHKKLILVQEGMTDPENIFYYLVRWLKLPRYLASTSTTGLSHLYDVFCVASEGYYQLFRQKGVQAHKMRVTGIPNYDNCIQYTQNSFPYRDYVLVATSDSRETFKYENRKKFIEHALRIADGRKTIFKLHPNENHQRATEELRQWAPDALVFSNGNAHEMVANCHTLITRFSTLAYTGIALNKVVYSEFDLQQLHRLLPLQNAGTSAQNIAQVCRELLGNPKLFQSLPLKKRPAEFAQPVRRLLSTVLSGQVPLFSSFTLEQDLNTTESSS